MDLCWVLRPQRYLLIGKFCFIEMFLDLLAMYCLERQTKMYFIYSSSVELAVKNFEARYIFVLTMYM